MNGNKYLAEARPPRQVGARRQVGRVVGITDGDTISVDIEGHVFRVRYLGIHTSEKGQPYSYQAMVGFEPKLEVLQNPAAVSQTHVRLWPDSG